MPDPAHELTDEILEEMELRLTAIYTRAEKEIEKTAEKYFKQFKRLDDQKRKLVQDGKLSEKEYKAWRRGKMLYSERFSTMKEQAANQLMHVNETALAYINNQLPKVYAINYNELAEDLGGIKGYSFTLTDPQTIKHLSLTDTSLLPYKELDPAKDIPWNMKKINGEVLQGIIQGDSIPEITARIATVQTMNLNAAVRTARTIVTEAENKGRQDSYEKAHSDGVEMKRVWIATNDTADPAYIKNRICYEDVHETITFPEAEVSGFAKVGGVWGLNGDPTNTGLVGGKKYKVKWDGTVYTCTCLKDYDAPYYNNFWLGNASLEDSGENTGEPFVLSYQENIEYPEDSSLYWLSNQPGASHTIQISTETGELVKIPEKFMPEIPLPTFKIIFTKGSGPDVSSDKRFQELRNAIDADKHIIAIARETDQPDKMLYIGWADGFGIDFFGMKRFSADGTPTIKKLEFENDGTIFDYGVFGQ